MRQVVAFFSDTHGGHKLGLLNPHTELTIEDENGNVIDTWQPQLTATQEWLWSEYTDDMKLVAQFAAGDPLIVVHNGDLTQGSKYKDQLVSTCTADQLIIAEYNMRPWLEIPNLKAFRLTRGTSSHIFSEGTATIIVCRLLQARYPEHDIKTTTHGLMTVDGVVLDYSHHGPSSGIRQWTSGNQVRYYTKSMANECILRGEDPPRVMIRSHFHEFIWETVRTYGKDRMWVTEALITPSYCGLGEYARQATRSKFSISHGLIMVEIIDGRLGQIVPVWRTVDLRTREEL